MQGYSRLGIYQPHLKAKKIEIKSKEKSVDWVNIGLLVLLVICILLFVIN